MTHQRVPSFCSIRLLQHWRTENFCGAEIFAASNNFNGSAYFFCRTTLAHDSQSQKVELTSRYVSRGGVYLYVRSNGSIQTGKRRERRDAVFARRTKGVCR